MINIYQNYFKEEQKHRLDKSFIPYDNSYAKVPEYYEFGPILDISKTKRYLDSVYTGLFSYKFNSKTNLLGSDFIQFVENNPGYDVYFINPYPHLPYFYFNVWEQGEFSHKGLSEVAQKVLQKLDVIGDISLVPRHNASMVCFSNFWIGNQKFWNIFSELVLKINELIENDVEIRNALFSPTFYSDQDAPFFPFVFERLFSTIISLDENISSLSYNHSAEEVEKGCFFEFENKALIERKKYIDALDKACKIDDLKSYFHKYSSLHHKQLKALVEENGIPQRLL